MNDQTHQTRQESEMSLESILPDADKAIIKQAEPFYEIIKDIEWKPKIWCYEGEVAFEWIGKGKHAIVSFDEESFGYAMMINGSFVGGDNLVDSPFEMPNDLSDYLSSRHPVDK